MLGGGLKGCWRRMNCRGRSFLFGLGRGGRLGKGVFVQGTFLMGFMKL